MKFRRVVGMSAALAAFLVAGCNGGGDSQTASTAPAGGTAAKPGASTDKKEFKIVMIAKANSNQVFQSAKTGAMKAAEELGKANNVNITIDWQTPDTEDAQQQAQRIDQAATQGVGAILISCSDASKVTSSINSAVDKGVPVMTFDSDAPDSKRFAFYGADDLSVGSQLSDEAGAVMKGKGNYAILAGNQNAPNLQKRVEGVKKEMVKFPDMKLVGVYYHPENAQDASAEVTREMNANPQINCWLMVGGWPLFNEALLNLDPNKVKIIAVDALPEELPYIQKGIAPVLLAQPTYDWGYKSVGIIVDKILLKKDVPAINKMELVRVDKDSLPKWAKQLDDWGFADAKKYETAAK